MKMSEMMEAMEKAGSNGGSQLHMRSEALQRKMKVPRIQRLRKGLKKKSKLLVVAELAFPFDPITGEVTDEFNPDTKYRPALSATTVALAMKDSANENPDLKEKLMKRVGMQEWDTSDCENFTDDDWKVFAPYRVPRIFTVVATHINIQAMGTGVYGADYAVSVQRDPKTGEIVGDVPGFIKVNKFFNDKAYEQINEYDAKIKSGELKQTDQQQQDYKSNIRNASPVTDDRPVNFIQMFEVPLDSKGVADVASLPEVSDMEVQTKYTKKIRLSLEKYLDGSWEQFDNYFDFWELDMNCPAEITGDPQSNSGKAQIGLDTTYDRAIANLNDPKRYASGESTRELVESVRKYLDNSINVEEKMRRSVNIGVYDEDVENNMFRTLKTVVDLKGDKYITQKVATANAEVISLIFGEEGDEFLEEIDAQISDRAEGTLDESASAADAKEAKKYDLSSEEFNADDLVGDMDSIDLGA